MTIKSNCNTRECRDLKLSDEEPDDAAQAAVRDLQIEAEEVNRLVREVEKTISEIQTRSIWFCTRD